MIIIVKLSDGSFIGGAHDELLGHVVVWRAANMDSLSRRYQSRGTQISDMLKVPTEDLGALIATLTEMREKFAGNKVWGAE